MYMNINNHFAATMQTIREHLYLFFLIRIKINSY